ncbi:hypothetical protein EI94DRAFT_1700580 [Lactarius quietus]|nr:hypothetical protein EI94DRAFT_1700580 [Lactarius quietus]
MHASFVTMLVLAVSVIAPALASPIFIHDTSDGNGLPDVILPRGPETSGGDIQVRDFTPNQRSEDNIGVHYGRQEKNCAAYDVGPNTICAWNSEKNECQCF